MAKYTDLILEKTSKWIYQNIVESTQNSGPFYKSTYINKGKTLQILFKYRDYPIIYIFIIYRDYTIAKFIHDARFNINTESTIILKEYQPSFDIKLYKIFGFDITYSKTRFYINGQIFKRSYQANTVYTYYDSYLHKFPVIEDLKL